MYLNISITDRRISVQISIMIYYCIEFAIGLFLVLAVSMYEQMWLCYVSKLLSNVRNISTLRISNRRIRKQAEYIHLNPDQDYKFRILTEFF